MQDSIYVILGGAMGCLLRYWLTSSVCLGFVGSNAFFSEIFNATMLVNILGCFLIGLLAGLPQGFLYLPQSIRLLLIVGFLGGFTTFSSYSFYTFELLQTGQVFKALFNALGSVVIGLLALYIGYFVIQFAYASISK